MLLSPLGERLGEGVLQRQSSVTPSPNLSPKGERKHEGAGSYAAVITPASAV